MSRILEICMGSYFQIIKIFVRRYISSVNTHMCMKKTELIDVPNTLLPIKVDSAIITDTFKKAREKDSEVLVVVTGTNAILCS
jgi:2-hydroxy-3-keto-5-methylthiopentenyl-1-phosphate phosphatase